MKRLLQTTLFAAALVIAWSVAPHVAVADTVRTTRTTRMMARPAEKSRVVKRVPAGRNMKVVDTKGRWLKVRVGSETGWVTRTSVRTAPQARTTVRKTRRRPFVEGRSTRRGWTEDAPEDRVGADAVDDIDEEEWDDAEEEADEPKAKPKKRVAKRKAKKKSKKRVATRDDDFEDEDEDWGEEDEDFEDEEEEEEEATDDGMVVVKVAETPVLERQSRRSDSVFIAEEGDKLFVVRASKDGEWLFVEDEEGDSGWIAADAVSKGGAGYEYPRLAYKADAGIGYTSMGMDFASDGQGTLAAYKIGVGALSLGVGGQAVYSGYGPSTLIMGDLRYRGTRANPGIRFTDPASGMATDTAFLMHQVDAGASVGYRTTRADGLAAYGRAGYHYGKFDVQDVANFETNLARIPSELLKGFTLGVHVDVPRFNDKISLHAGFDMMVSGQRVQTVGLEDGLTSKVSAMWGVAHADYKLKSGTKIVADYRFWYSKTDWAGAAPGSMRGHNATTAARLDKAHTLTIGVGKSF